ncbi:MAG: patatin-like phospholipase family protein [Planctomycetes bacterium]|nr:patatin-like phospholipase family protein [Planctomycetota bacterium]
MAAYLVPIALALAVVIGCKAKPIHGPEHLVGKVWMNADGSPPSRDGDSEAVAGLSAVLAGQPPPVNPGKPLNMLIMSGGGKYGAFTAGVLAGWTASGDRPTFDVATGVSSGAATACLAFLGPKYDDRLRANFTNLKRSDLYKLEPFKAITEKTGFFSSAPREQRIGREITPEFMCDMQAAYAAGRRVYVGTVEVLTNRPTIWDITAIASSGRPDAPTLIRKILVAACSPTGAVRPIEICVEVNGVKYREMHTDAGNMLQGFVRTPAGIPPGSTAWVLSAGKFYRDPMRNGVKVINLVAGGVSNSLYALFRSDLVKLYALCAVSRAEFRLLALPNDFKGAASSFAFDPAELEKLYWIGYQLTAGKAEWRHAPPDTLPGEASPPRTGLEFIVQP